MGCLPYAAMYADPSSTHCAKLARNTMLLRGLDAQNTHAAIMENAPPQVGNVIPGPDEKMHSRRCPCRHHNHDLDAHQK